MNVTVFIKQNSILLPLKSSLLHKHVYDKILTQSSHVNKKCYTSQKTLIFQTSQQTMFDLGLTSSEVTIEHQTLSLT